jgi:hypothetical protein
MITVLFPKVRHVTRHAGQKRRNSKTSLDGVTHHADQKLALGGKTQKQVLKASRVTLANLALNSTMFFCVTFVQLDYLWE